MGPVWSCLRPDWRLPGQLDKSEPVRRENQRQFASVEGEKLGRRKLALLVQLSDLPDGGIARTPYALKRRQSVRAFRIDARYQCAACALQVLKFQFKHTRRFALVWRIQINRTPGADRLFPEMGRAKS